MQKEAEKFAQSSLMEGMFSIRAVLRAGEEGISDRKIEKILFDREKAKSKAKELSFLRAKAKEHGFSIEFTDAAKIDELTVGNSHGGIVAFCTERSVPSVSEMNIRENGFYVMLEGIEDPYNFGYALRSLYAAGVSGIILPPRNWMQASGVVARASAGASELLPMYLSSSADEVLPMFQSLGYMSLCAGIRNSVSIFEEQFPLPVLLVIGGEKRGISRTVLDQADRIVRIDYGRSFNGSLSAASAATVMGFEIFRQNRDLLSHEEVASDKL